MHTGVSGGQMLEPLELKSWLLAICSGCWDLNWGPLQEPQVSLTVEPPPSLDCFPVSLSSFQTCLFLIVVFHYIQHLPSN